MSDSPSPYVAPNSGMSAPPEEAIPPTTTSIPKVFGIIHIVYACAGMISAVIGVGALLVMKVVLSKAGEELEEMNTILDAYNEMAIYTYIDAALKIVLGIFLLVAGVGLLKRKLWAQKASITWAIVRMVLIIGMTVATYGVSLEFQEKMGEISQNQPGQFDQSQFQASMQGIGSVFGVIMVCIYPVITIIFMSKKVVKDSLR